MKKLIFIIGAAFMALAQNGLAADYQYVSAEELKGWLVASKSILLVDIQEKNDFLTHHIKGSLETNAYPVKSDAEREVLNPALSQAKDHDAVVVVCPRGKGGAMRTYDYLKKKGVPEEKLSILTGGMAKWTYQEWVDTK